MKKSITLAGNIIVDHIREVDQYPEHSNLAAINRTYNSLGGAVSNSGLCLARLDPDLDVHAIGVIGDDADGRFILDEFHKFPNFHTDQIVFGKLNSAFTDVISDTTNKTRTFFTYKGANSELSPEHFDFENFKTDILHIGYILLLDTLDEPDAEYGTKMARVLHMAQEAGIKTSIDVVTENSDRFRTNVPPAIKYCDYCIINEEEASRTVGIKARHENGDLDIEACKQICRKLFDLGVKEWVVIHSREGGIGLDNKGNFALKASLNIAKKDIKGTTGAGDAFLAGVLYGASQKYPISKAIALGIATSNASILAEGPTEGVKTEPEIWELYDSYEKEKWPGFDAE